MTITIVLATNNKHKISEIKAILKKTRRKFILKTLDDFPNRRPVVENQPTIEGNAIKKALEVAKQTKCISLADDTGLFINALKGKPGVYSARFAGPKCSFDDNNAKVLRLMKQVPTSRRGASFRCIAALASPKGKVVFAEGMIRGKIVDELKGGKGFGYDPIFYYGPRKMTLAEMRKSHKNRISHRGRAFRQVPTLIKKLTKSI